MLLLTPSWCPKARADKPLLACESNYIARNQVVSGSLVDSKTVPANRKTWRLQWLHWKVARRVARLAELGCAAARPDQAAGPAGVVEGLLALGFGAEVGEEQRQTEAFLELDFVLGHGGGQA